MARGLVHAAALLSCVAWSIRALGCDPAAAKTNTAFSDADGDGLSDIDERTVYGTSPVLDDTDGDGMSDYDEIVRRSFDPIAAPLRFNPRIADVPLMEVKVIAPPVISLRLVATDGQTWSYETSQSFEQGISETAGTSLERSTSRTAGGSESRSGQVEVVFQDDSLVIASNPTTSDPNGKPKSSAPNKLQMPAFFARPDVVTVTNGLASTIDWSNTNGTTLTFSASQTRELRRAVAFAQTYAQSHELSASGGILEVLVELHNRGNLPFRIDNMILCASFVVSSGDILPVTNLETNSQITTFSPYSIAPGGRQGPINFFRDSLTLEQVALIAQNLDALDISVGIYELTNAAGKPYAFDAPAIHTRTATLGIDYGGRRPPERHLVATNLDPARPGVTLRRVFEEILRIPFELDAESGLSSVRNVAGGDPGGPGRWTIRLVHLDGGEEVTEEYAPPLVPEAMTLRAGDVVLLRLSAS